MGLSQPHVNRTLRRLEDHVGGALIVRSNRTSALTELGESLGAEVEPHVAGLTRALERRRVETAPWRLGMVAQSAAGGPCLPSILAEFAWRHPQSAVRVIELGVDDPLGPLRRGQVDVICGWLPLREEDLLVGPLLTVETRVVLASRRHRLASAESVRLEDLADHALVDALGLPAELAETLLPSRTPNGRRIPQGPPCRP